MYSTLLISMVWPYRPTLQVATPMARSQQILEPPLEVYICKFISPSLSLARCLLQGRTFGALMGHAYQAAIPSLPILGQDCHHQFTGRETDDHDRMTCRAYLTVEREVVNYS